MKKTIDDLVKDIEKVQTTYRHNSDNEIYKIFYTKGLLRRNGLVIIYKNYKTNRISFDTSTKWSCTYLKLRADVCEDDLKVDVAYRICEQMNEHSEYDFEGRSSEIAENFSIEELFELDMALSECVLIRDYERIADILNGDVTF